MPPMTPHSRTRLDRMTCPIARSLGAVGDGWSMLIVRDVLRGRRRFDELQSHLGIATNLLSDRLRSLVEAGMIERRPYSERPLRHEYHATAKALDFQPVLFALLAWGNRD